MTQISSPDSPYATSIVSLRRALLRINIALDEDPNAGEKAAKTISAILKALADIEVREMSETARQAKTQHMSYKDLPPPTPEEAAHFRARFDRMVEVRADEKLAAFISGHIDV